MQLGEILREARERHGMTQEQLGNMVAYERSMISNIERNRRQASPECLARLQARLMDTRLAAQSCGHCQQGGLIAGAIIADNLDGHFAELLDVAQQEMSEFQKAYEKFLFHRRTGSWEQEQTSAQECAKQAWDMIPLIVTLSIKMNQHYGIYHNDILREVNTSVLSLSGKISEKRKAANEAAKSKTTTRIISQIERGSQT